jgi:hypothetical protein
MVSKEGLCSFGSSGMVSKEACVPLDGIERRLVFLWMVSKEACVPLDGIERRLVFLWMVSKEGLCSFGWYRKKACVPLDGIERPLIGFAELQTRQ